MAIKQEKPSSKPNFRNEPKTSNLNNPKENDEMKGNRDELQ